MVENEILSVKNTYFQKCSKVSKGESRDCRFKGSASTRATALAAHPRCSSKQKTLNAWKSIKKCKQGRQTVHTIHLKHNCHTEIRLIWTPGNVATVASKRGLFGISSYGLWGSRAAKILCLSRTTVDRRS